ncbi:MAG TPA: L-2-amino-thiazoline-4-carboxylic acid hydrolase [Anaerolineaceae bacterium]|nr:L-2-amino-thiazoline-4-carboxylic acid hydrolase [Anaerolineaceae bacterium]HPN51569.1 L-2-amino-thiazoline-4-carboxylic acid hydrolase [Anaerolineaceae bacterium]
MKRKWLILGLGAGLLGGAIVASALRERRLPEEKDWQAYLSKKWDDSAKAAFLMARVQTRFVRLYAERPRFAEDHLRDHLEEHILPGLALYQVLLEDGMEKDAALELCAEMIALHAREVNRVVQKIGGQPFFFFLLRKIIRSMMDYKFSTGWTTTWIEDSPQRVAFDITRCFYLDTLRFYGAPELTPAFCASDDAMMEGISPQVAWKRTTTLGRGDERCNFCYERVAPETAPCLNAEAGEPAPQEA